MKLMIAATAIYLIGAMPVSAQINTAIVDADLMPIFVTTNKCLTDFDAKAKAKKFSAGIYKTAIRGACATEISELHGLVELHNEGSSDHQFFVRQHD